jgi:hypothetical protein
MMIGRRSICGGLASLTLAACGSAAPRYHDPADLGSGKRRADDVGLPVKKWGQGLPAKGSFCHLLYNEPSQCLVAAFQQRIDDVRWSEDLYYRHRSSAEYLQIPGSNDHIHYSYAISPANVPKVFFNVTRWNEIGGDWESISSFDLVTSKLRTDVTKADFGGQEVQPAWVSSLISVSDDASHLVCTVGFEERLASGAAIVHYWLCDIRLTDFALTRLSPLPDVFA